MTPWAIAILVLAPLAAANVLSSAGSLSESLSSYVRMASQFALSTIILVRIGTQKARGSAPAVTGPSAKPLRGTALLFLAMIALASISTIINRSDTMSFLRTFAVSTSLFSMLILVPAMAFRDTTSLSFMKTLHRWFIVISLVLLATVVGFYVASPHPGWVRLGYPLSAGVFAYYMLVALVLVSSTSRSKVLAIVFSVAILFSGSRSAIALAAMVLIVLNAKRYRVFLVAFGAGLLAAVQLIDYDRWFRPVFLDRDDISAGRTILWQHAVERILHRPLFGYGSPQRIFVDRPEGLVAHNSILDLSLTYGILYAMFALIAWFVAFAPTRLAAQDGAMKQYFWPALLLFVIVSAKAMVTNTFWTNMGDPVTLFVCLVLATYRAHCLKLPFGGARENSAGPLGTVVADRSSISGAVRARAIR